MRRIAWLAVILSLVLSAAPLMASETKQPLRVLYVGKTKKERANEFEKLLRTHFADVTIVDRTDFEPAATKGADVVVFDWSQSDSNLESTKVPFGRFEDWT